MRKLLVLLCTAGLFGFASCGSEEPVPEPEPPQKIANFERLLMRAAVQSPAIIGCEGKVVLDSTTRIVLVQTFVLNEKDTISSIDTLFLAPEAPAPDIYTPDPEVIQVPDSMNR